MKFSYFLFWFLSAKKKKLRLEERQKKLSAAMISRFFLAFSTGERELKKYSRFINKIIVELPSDF